MIDSELGLERILGPRLEGHAIIIETEAAGARIALKLSRATATELARSLTLALAAANNSDLPAFLRARELALAPAPSAMNRHRPSKRQAKRASAA